MPDHFRSPHLRIGRAEHHIRDLKREIDGWVNEKPWARTIEVDPNGLFKEYKLKLTRNITDAASVIVADAITSLRSALDQCGAAAARASGISKPKKAYFPFAPDPEGVMNSAKGWSKDVPPDIVTLMCSFKPYETGNPLLWAISRIRNVDDHFLLRPMTLSAPVISIMSATGVFNTPGSTLVFPGVFDNEVTYFRGPVTMPDFEHELDIRLDVAFGEVDVVSGKPAFTILGHMLSMTTRIVDIIETETRRLFPNAFV
jgi:hypothetical protein